MLSTLARALVMVLLGAVAARASAPADGDATAALTLRMERVRTLLGEGRGVEAEAAARALVTDVEGGEAAAAHLADALELLATSLAHQGRERADEARQHAERAVALRERAHGSGDPSMARSLGVLARALEAGGDLAGARRARERVLALDEASFGAAHPTVARDLALLAGLDRDAGDRVGALERYERALALLEAYHGPEHVDVADVLQSMAKLARDTGDFASARARYERALAMRERLQGAGHLEVAMLQGDLAISLGLMGDAAAAQPLFERAIATRERLEGPSAVGLTASLNGLANLHAVQGRYVEAKPLYERALAILEGALGPRHPKVAIVLNGLASLAARMGDFATARTALTRALEIGEAALGPDHSDLAPSVLNLGNVTFMQGDNEAARAHFERALAIVESKRGTDNLGVVQCLSNLATVLTAMGDTQGARRSYERAIDVAERVLGESHEGLAESLNSLASLLQNAGDHAAAVPLLERSLAILERALGPDHPRVAMGLSNLAVAASAAGENARAVDLALRSEAISREHLRATARSLGARQALRYARARLPGLNAAVALATDHPEFVARTWDAVVRSRALVQDEMASRHASAHGSMGPEVEALAEASRRAADDLATLAVRGPDGRSPEEHAREVERARLEAERAEEALAARSAASRADRARSRVGLADVLGGLADGDALVAYLRVEQDYVSGAEPADVVGERALPPEARPSYVAFVARGGTEAAPAAVRLGEARDLDELITRWRASVVSPAAPPSERSAAGHALRRAAWDPIAVHVAGARRVFVVPDGALHLVALAALPAPDGVGYLVESPSVFHALSAERDLADEAPPPGMGGLLAIGGPAFGTPVRRDAAQPTAPLQFGGLPGSARETSDVTRSWRRGGGKALHLRGTEATEAAFKEHAPRHEVLHVATHGFFLDERGGGSTAGLRGVIAMSDDGDEADEPDELSPLLRSGLALAGANRHDRASTGADDGVLTAQEIAGLDLTGCTWAVLSACGTGLGDVQAGEGVLGLQRAFRVAGARTVVMSLWSVEDETTRRFMRELYRARLERRLDTPSCVREASLAVLRERRDRGEDDSPFWWGAFVASGDWH